MIEISYSFVADDHRAQVRVRLEDAPPVEDGKPPAVPLWTWQAGYSTKRGVGGGESHDPKKTKSAGYATHQQALTAGVAMLRDLYLSEKLPAGELDKLLSQV